MTDRFFRFSLRQYEGNNFVEKAKTFSHDPLDAEKRSEMIKSSRQLVREVTKLLILGEFRNFRPIKSWNIEYLNVQYYLLIFLNST